MSTLVSEHDGVLRRLPTPLAIHLLVLAGVLLAAVLAKGAWDSDYFWHVTTGELIAGGQFPTTDPYSFTWGGRPWTLHEWLSELLLFRLVDGIGYVGAVLVFAVFPGAVFGILGLALGRASIRTPAIALATVLGALVLIPYMTLRPQVLSWVLFAALMAGLLFLTPPRRRWALAAFPLFVLWANLHGLWAVALGFLGLYLVLTLLRATPMREAPRWVAAGLGLAVLGTAITPAGPLGILYPLRYVEGGDWGLANITEWQSPDFHDPAHLPLLVFILVLAFVGRRGVPLWLSLFALLGVALALTALRNAPVAAIVALPALAMGIDDLLPRRVNRRSQPARTARARRGMELALGGVVLVGAWVILVPSSLTAPIDENLERELPVQGVERLLEVDPDARVVAEYGWGGYVINRLYPSGGRVMVDGRNDMYDQSILEEYGEVRSAGPEWRSVADRYDVDALLFPPEMPITRGPAETAGWCEAYRDDNEVLYLRRCPAA